MRGSNSTANVATDGAGHLQIRPLRDGAGNWTSGRIETRRTDFRPEPGGMLAVEAAIQQPNVSGTAAAGYWPAFWMLGAPFRGTYTNWPAVGEIDILETNRTGSAGPSTAHATSPSRPARSMRHVDERD